MTTLEPPHIELRGASPEDLDAIARLHTESWRFAYRGIYPDAYLDGDLLADRLAVWRPRLEAPSPNQHIVLAWAGGELLGLAFSLGDADSKWGTLLDNLHVSRGHQGAGLGRSLMRESALWSRDRYPKALFHLWVLDANVRARRFYELMGGVSVDSETHEPPGGGPTLGWRYVWDPVDTLIERTELPITP